MLSFSSFFLRPVSYLLYFECRKRSAATKNRPAYFRREKTREKKTRIRARGNVSRAKERTHGVTRMRRETERFG